MTHFDMFDFHYIPQVAFIVLGALLLLIPFWQICRKAGFSGFLSLLVLVPIVNLLFLYFLAFSEWDESEQHP